MSNPEYPVYNYPGPIQVTVEMGEDVPTFKETPIPGDGFMCRCQVLPPCTFQENGRWK